MIKEDWQKVAIPDDWSVSGNITYEQLYQAFKQRMMEEVLVAHSWTEWGGDWYYLKDKSSE